MVEKEGETPREKMKRVGSGKVAQSPGRAETMSANQGINFAGGHGNGIRPSRTTGWRPGCDCGGEPVPCTVLDPFSGSGTTGLVALRLGRRYLGIELNPEYIAMSKRRMMSEASQLKLDLLK